jgi:hypothetical protein
VVTSRAHPTAPLLTTRALNRATLARQLLLERSSRPIAETVEHLVGLQAQTTRSWYVGLWSRLEGFRAEDASDLLERRELVRLSLMRGTIHLVTVRDAWGLRPLMQPAFDRILAGNFAGGLKGVDLDELTATGAAILAETPLSASKLRERLTPRWPENDPVALSTAVLLRTPVVQVTPRGLWGKSGQTVHTTLEAWVGKPQPAYALGGVLLRYLRAFGPASVADMAAWSGLPGLREVVETLRPQLLTFRDEHGRELFDLPDAPRPDADTPAPPRFLYDYDNVALSHADRTRLISESDRKRALERIGASSFGGVLVDGVFAGLWRVRREGPAKGSAILEIELARPVPKPARDALAEEGARLLGFLATDAETRDIEFSERGDNGHAE